MQGRQGGDIQKHKGGMLERLGVAPDWRWQEGKAKDAAPPTLCIRQPAGSAIAASVDVDGGVPEDDGSSMARPTPRCPVAVLLLLNKAQCALALPRVCGSADGPPCGGRAQASPWRQWHPR